jgi:hypothetical protein
MERARCLILLRFLAPRREVFQPRVDSLRSELSRREAHQQDRKKSEPQSQRGGPFA